MSSNSAPAVAATEVVIRTNKSDKSAAAAASKPATTTAASSSAGGAQLDLYAFPFENIVFEGGSSNLLAYVGAVRSLEEAGVWSQVKRLGASGSGGLVAALLAVNYNSQQLETLLNFDLRVLIQDHCCGCCCFCCSMLCCYGWNANDKLIKWLTARVKESTGKGSATFQEIYKKFGRELCLVVTNVSNGCVEYCHVKTTPHLPVVDAVRMTLATPGLCRPVTRRRNNRDQWFATGGIFYNYPIHCFDGWWLSLKSEDNFLSRHGLLNEQSRLTDDPNRFTKFNSKTLGFVLYDEFAHDGFTKQLAERSKLKAVVPDTKLAKLWNQKVVKFESSLETYASYTAAANKFVSLMRSNISDMSSTLDKTHIEKILQQTPSMSTAELKTLFNKHITVDEIWNEIKPKSVSQVTGNDVICYLENASFSRYRHCQQHYIQTDINSLSDYLESVQVSVHATNSRHTASKDVERTVGINCRYLAGFHNSQLTKQDQQFLIDQGRLATRSFLEHYATATRPPLKDSLNRQSFCRDDLTHFIDDDVSEIIDEHDYMENIAAARVH